MKKRILSFALALAMVLGLMPFSAISAFAADDYSTGLGDTATYFLNVPDDVNADYSTITSYFEGVDKELVKIGNETFISHKPKVSWLNAAYDPWARINTVQHTYGGFIDDKAVDLSAINYFAWRIKIPAGEKPLAFSLFMEHDLYSEIFNTGACTFIDNKTREVSTAITPGYGRGKAVLVNAGEGFDGWMILDLNQDFIVNYTHGDIPQKEFFLGIVDEGVERTAANSFTGVFHLGFHRNADADHMDATYVTDFADREILLGDALIIENIDTFKAVRFSCDELGHEKEIVEYITAPTCISEGLAKLACKHCKQDMGTEVVPEAHDYEITKVEPTMTEVGYTLHTCKTCGESYKDDYVAAGSLKENVYMGMYHFPDHMTDDQTDDRIPDAQRLEIIESVFKAGYVNTITTNGNNSLFREKIRLCKEYNIKFWLFTTLYNSESTTIDAYINSVEKITNIVKEENAWDLFLGFHWDEPAHNGQSGDDFLAMTKALYEKWGKRNYPVFAISTFLEKFYSTTGSARPRELYTTEHMTYVTDAGWDIYYFDLRDSANSNASQRNDLAALSRQYGETFATAKDYYRYVHRMLAERIDHEFSSWFFPATKYGSSHTGMADEGYMMGQIEGFNEILMEQANPGGLMLYTYTTWGSETGLEERLPIKDYAGNQLVFPEVEKYTDLAQLIIETKEEYDNTPVYVPDDIVAGSIDVSKREATRITLDPVRNYVYSIDGENWINSGSFENLTPETAYTIIAKKISTGETKEFVVSTKKEKPYATGLNDTASYIVKLPTSYATAFPGWVGMYIGRLTDDSDWKNDYYGILHYRDFDSERFLELYKQPGYEDNLLISLGFGDTERLVEKGFSDGIDTSKLSGFAFRVKTTGGDESVESSFGIYINETVAQLGTYYYIDKNGTVTEGTDHIKITNNIDGWIVIPFDSFKTAQSGVTNREWFSENITGIGIWMHDGACKHGYSSSWGSRKLYLGDMMVYEDLDKFMCVRADQHNYESSATRPTCTEAGTVTYTCTVCGYTYSKETKPATGHTYENGICNDCGTEHADHNWTETGRDPATCVSAEQIYYSCMCGATKTEDGAGDPDAHNFKGGACEYCGTPYSISFATGKGDTASYVLDVSAADEYSTIIRYSEGYDFEIVESDGESFLSCKPRANWTNHSYDPWARIYTYENTFGGFTDGAAIDLSAINYFAWRIKIPAGETPIAFSLFMEHDLYAEIFNTGACTFIDNKTREVSTAITPGYGRGKAVLVNAGEGFDGWMILDLNQDFIVNYTHGDIPQKEFFLGIVDEGVERTAANSFTGVFHLGFHRNADTDHMDATYVTDFTNREVLFGDALIIENIDTFKAVRFSCDELGHVYEDGACKFCGEEDLNGPPVVYSALSVTSKTTNTLAVSWNAISGVNEYYVQVSDKATDAVVTTRRAVDTTSTIIYNLTAGTEYKLAICAYKPGTPAVYSEPIETKTEGYATLGLTATQKGNEVEFNWTKPANAVAYYVYILKGDETVKVAGVQNPDQTTFTFMLPKEAGTYSFGIISATNSGAGNVYSTMQLAAEQIEIAAIDSGLNVVSKTTNTLAVSWNAISGVNEYYVQVSDKATGAVVTTRRAVDTTSTIIYNLTAGTEYKLAICAYKPGTPAVYSEPIETKTEGYATLGLTATQKGNEVEFNWTKPANAVAYYVYILKGDETVKVAGVQNPDQTTFTFMLPKEAGTYSFGIISATNSGAGNVYSTMQLAAETITIN